jgi:hypothetical protein
VVSLTKGRLRRTRIRSLALYMIAELSYSEFALYIGRRVKYQSRLSASKDGMTQSPLRRSNGIGPLENGGQVERFLA